ITFITASPARSGSWTRAPRSYRWSRTEQSRRSSRLAGGRQRAPRCHDVEAGGATMNGVLDESYEPLLDELEAIMAKDPPPEEGRLVALLWKIGDYYRHDSGNPGVWH